MPKILLNTISVFKDIKPSDFAPVPDFSLSIFTTATFFLNDHIMMSRGISRTYEFYWLSDRYSLQTQKTPNQKAGDFQKEQIQISTLRCT